MSMIETFSNLSNHDIQQLNANCSPETTSAMQQFVNNIKNSPVTMETKPQETSNSMTRVRIFINGGHSITSIEIW